MYNNNGDDMHIRLKKWVKVLIFIIIICTLFFLYSRYIETNLFNIKEYPVVNSNIPSNFYGLKIVQISDIHYKSINDKKYLNKVVKKINLLKPDIVILSGDLFDSNIKYSKSDYEDLVNILKNINYNIGKYAIIGEEDNLDKWNYVIENSDFINLNDNFDFIYNEGLDPILLVGISSNYKNNHIKSTMNEIYSKINIDYKYSILVLHEPDFIDDINYNKFNLILAGHSHKGEIVLPFINGIIKKKYSSKYFDDYYNLDNTELYISSGLGTGKYKLRFLNPPSINFYRLRNK